jgi:hypothetical protein
MGDVFINYDEYGRKYLRRIVYLNVILYIIIGIALLLFWVDAFLLLLLAFIAAGTSLAYVFYFIRKNPPIEYPDEKDSEN